MLETGLQGFCRTPDVDAEKNKNTLVIEILFIELDSQFQVNTWQ